MAYLYLGYHEIFVSQFSTIPFSLFEKEMNDFTLFTIEYIVPFLPMFFSLNMSLVHEMYLMRKLLLCKNERNKYY